MAKEISDVNFMLESDKCTEITSRCPYYKHGDDFSKFSHALSLIEHPAMESVFSASCNTTGSIEWGREQPLILVKQ